MNFDRAQAAHIWLPHLGKIIRDENQSPNPGMEMEVEVEAAIKPPSVAKP